LNPGWPDPRTFTTTPEFGNPQWLAVFFRNGEFVPRTGLTFIAYPISGNTLVAQPSGSPWTQSDVLRSVSSPGLFTSDGTGKGPGAILNSGSLNSPANPAAMGSIVVLRATGEGATSPAGVDGKLAVPPYTVPLLPVSVIIDDIVAEIEYEGAAPEEVAGVMQINVKVPCETHSGSVAVSLMVGDAKSQDSVTLAVR
jgi:uncharacterized protein (TIGR03437 family)